jgi:hypothetical protein
VPAVNRSKPDPLPSIGVSDYARHDSPFFPPVTDTGHNIKFQEIGQFVNVGHRQAALASHEFRHHGLVKPNLLAKRVAAHSTSVYRLPQLVGQLDSFVLHCRYPTRSLNNIQANSIQITIFSFVTRSPLLLLLKSLITAHFAGFRQQKHPEIA